MEPQKKAIVVDVLSVHRRRAFSKAAARAEKTENELFIERLAEHIEKEEKAFDFRFQVPAALYDRACAIAVASGIPVENIFKAIVAPAPLMIQPVNERKRKPLLRQNNVLIDRELLDEVRQETRRRNVKIQDFVRVALENRLSHHRRCRGIEIIKNDRRDNRVPFGVCLPAHLSRRIRNATERQGITVRDIYQQALQEEIERSKAVRLRRLTNA
jgi:hypothetical protein